MGKFLFVHQNVMNQNFIFSLKMLDIAFLRSLQDRVNIVPVIAKADTLTQNELTRFKQNVILYSYFPIMI